VSLLEIRWSAKRTTTRVLYCRNPMSPIYLLWDSSCKLIIYCGTHPPELIKYRPIRHRWHGIVRDMSQNFCCLLWIDEAKANIKPIYECRCNGRLQTKRFTRLSHTGLVVYGPSFYRIEMLALLNDMIIVDRYLWEWLNTQTSVLDVLVLSRDERVRSDWVVSSLMKFRMIWFSQSHFSY